MIQLPRLAFAACIAAIALAACGGGNSKSSVTPELAVNAQHRAVRTTIPCTPDSYGYCAVQTYHQLTFVHCNPRINNIFGYTTGSTVYEVYNSTSDLGSYTETFSGDCTNGGSIDWPSGEPSVVYGDPNLP